MLFYNHTENNCAYRYAPTGPHLYKKMVLIQLPFAFLKQIHLQIKLCKLVFSERKSDCSP